MKAREWFDGIRLSTSDQDRLVERLRADSSLTSIATGDTMVLAEHGYFTVYRQDFSHMMDHKEYAERNKA